MVHSKGTTESQIDKCTAACHNLVRCSHLSIPHSNKVDGLSSTQNAVLVTNVPINPLRMNSDICNSSSLLHFNVTQLPFPLGD